MKSRNIIIGIALILLLVFVIIAGWIMATPPKTVLQGEAEAKHVKVASKIPGRIDRILVRQGTKVSRG
ncbi:MAG: biotin/lipoyl-binding protein, partial [Bacteroidales bacterium]|nr:biotin/lipoyl-binding protein [Bacteroidales bacterium]